MALKTPLDLFRPGLKSTGLHNLGKPLIVGRNQSNLSVDWSKVYPVDAGFTIGDAHMNPEGTRGVLPMGTSSVAYRINTPLDVGKIQIMVQGCTVLDQYGTVVA